MNCYHNHTSRFLSLFFLSLVLITCKRNEIPVTGLPYQPIDFDQTVNASISGWVTSEEGQALIGAEVTFGNRTTHTDKFGHFTISMVPVKAQAAISVVNFPGYFKNIRTFVVNEGQSVFCRVVMLPKPAAVRFNASSGGMYMLPEGGMVSLPGLSVIHEASGQPYSGNVDMIARWINPLDERLWDKMPGDLRGVLTDGNAALLETYGMVAVELNSSDGEKLQIAPGKKASIRFPIPAQKLSRAPATMPLWYFDEQKGVWKEEGTAVLQGGYYEGEVAHFSFWNCDMPQANVQFSARIVDPQNQPVSGLMVKMTAMDDATVFRSSYTNQQGMVSGFLLDGKSWRMDVMDNGCTLISRNFQPGSSSLHVGDVILPAGRMFHLSGNLYNCNGGPVNQGKIIINIGQTNYLYEVAGGAFNIPIYTNCSDSARFTMLAIDEGNHTQGWSRYFVIGSDWNVGAYQACGDNLEEYSQLLFNGEEYIQGPYVNGTFTSSCGFDAFRTYFNPTLIKKINGVFVRNNDHLQWALTHNPLPPTPTSIHSLVFFGVYHGIDLGYITKEYKTIRSSDLSISITEYGPPQVGYVSGSINGTLYRVLSYNVLDTLNPVRISYQFRNKRDI